MDLDSSTLGGFDLEMALSTTRGDEQLLAVIEIGLKQLHSHRAAIAEALRCGELARVSAAAHNLEATAAGIRARRIAGVALEVERMARSACMTHIDDVLAVLDAEIQRIQDDVFLLN